MSRLTSNLGVVMQMSLKDSSNIKKNSKKSQLVPEFDKIR